MSQLYQAPQQHVAPTYAPSPPFVNQPQYATQQAPYQAPAGYQQSNIVSREKQQYQLNGAPVTAPQPLSAPPGYQTANAPPQTPQYASMPQQQYQSQQCVSPQQAMNPQPPLPAYQQQVQYPQQPMMTPAQQTEVQKFISHMPAEKLQAIEQIALQRPQQQPVFSSPPQSVVISPTPQTQQAQRPNFVSTAPSGLFGSKQSGGHKHDHSKDAQQTGKVQRFLGDTLVGRFARASVQTATSVAKMPAALSPWGDNNPVTLPNVRYRDAVLFTVFAGVGAPMIEGADGIVSDIFGADSFVSDVVSSGAGFITGSTIVKYGVFQIVEQAIDKGIIEHMLPEEEKMIETLNVTSLQVGIKHKLMGVDADIRFHAVRPTVSSQSCEKGWFAPYFFASSRTPIIPRANDFAIGQFFGPFLGADYAMAHKLLSEAPHALSMCDPDPTHDIGTNRLICIFTGISPYRADMWSTSRRPGCGTLVFHMFDGCPALILPVTKKCPVVAWSPWTLSQMRTGGGGWAAEKQHEEICDWLDGVLSLEHLNPSVREKYVEVLGRAVSLVLNGALALEKIVDKTILGKVDAERAGVVFFRY